MPGATQATIQKTAIGTAATAVHPRALTVSGLAVISSLSVKTRAPAKIQESARNRKEMPWESNAAAVAK